MKPPELAAPEVLVALPTHDVVTDYEDFTGNTDAVYTVEVRARVNGYLDKVLFKDGSEVKEGDLLFEIDPRPYKAELDRAQSAVELAEAHLARLQNDNARAVALLSRNAIGREEYDKIIGDFNEAGASVGTAKAVRDIAKLNLEFTKVTAPISGMISERKVVKGNLVKADETMLTTIVSVDPMYIYFDIDETTLLKIRKLLRDGTMKSYREEERTIQLGLANEDDFPHRGKINFTDNRVTQNTGTLRVRGEIENPKSTSSKMGTRMLSPGLFVRVRLPIGPPRDSIQVPERAVGTDQGNKFLFVIDPKTDEVRKRTVTVGLLDAGKRVILTGLRRDEQFVVGGLQRIREGLKVRPKMTPPEPAADQAGKDGATPPRADSARTPAMPPSTAAAVAKKGPSGG